MVKTLYFVIKGDGNRPTFIQQEGLMYPLFLESIMLVG